MSILLQIFFSLQSFYYWVKNQSLNDDLIKIIGDVFYGLGIGVAGNGFYDLLSTGSFDTVTVIVGFFAIIVGAILKK